MSTWPLGLTTVSPVRKRRLQACGVALGRRRAVVDEVDGNQPAGGRHADGDGGLVVGRQGGQVVVSCRDLEGQGAAGVT